MSGKRFAEEFKKEIIKQVTVRDIPLWKLPDGLGLLHADCMLGLRDTTSRNSVQLLTQMSKPNSSSKGRVQTSH